MVSLRFVLLFLATTACHAFSSNSRLPRASTWSMRLFNANDWETSFQPQQFKAKGSFQPVFDFGKVETVESFDRIDDAIMGGISTSTVRNVPNQSYASWSGVCRLDGGGFCGMRTLPFVEPLNVSDAQGFYLDCRFASDDEPDRRVWKMTTRTESAGRGGEVVYQAQFHISQEGKTEWSRIKVPFLDFVKVRGPRTVPDAPPLNTTGGLYQVGLSLSKFVIGPNVTELEDFRPGFFELQLKAIGLYKNDASSMHVTTPDTLDATQAKEQRPFVFKLLVPVFKVLFSEQKRRRRSAMKLLREQRNMTRWNAILFGIRKRRASSGWVKTVATTLGILLDDCVSTITQVLVRFGLFYPLIYASRIIKFISKKLSPKTRATG